MKGEPNEPRKIVDRKAFIQTASLMRSPEDGKLTLVLGGKSVGKTLVVSHVADTSQTGARWKQDRPCSPICGRCLPTISTRPRCQWQVG